MQLTGSKSDLSKQMQLLEVIEKGLGNHTSYRVSLEEGYESNKGRR